ncbi:MIF4GD family protein [Megaselia abdita]
MADHAAATAAHQLHNANKSIRISPDKLGNMGNMNNMNQNVIIRERSFIRNNNQQNSNKNRRSLAIMPNNQQGNMRGAKPTMEIYRPPNVRLDNKLNINAQEFNMNSGYGTAEQQLLLQNQQQNQQLQLLNNTRSSIIYPTHGGHMLQQSKSSASIPLHQQMQHLNAVAAANRHRANAIPIIHPDSGLQIQDVIQGQFQRSLMVSNPIQMRAMGLGMSHHPLVNSPSTGNLLQPQNHRVKFAPEPQIQRSSMQNFNKVQQNNVINNNGTIYTIPPLQRSKSLSSADAMARGLAGLGLGLGGDQADIGPFSPDIQTLMDKAVDDPNQLSARNLMELTNHIMQRSIEGRRYALPTSKVCLTIIAKERKETFLEAMLNNCRQWYQEREKILYTYQGMKTPARTKFTAFMAFLTEMFCQLKRRQLQLRTQCDGAPPSLVLLTLLSKCCEDCVKPPIRSLSEIECLFFVLTCIGRDLETQLPKQLEKLLGSVRDAFLNSSASAPAIRRTLLQLIELHASNWQLPGNTVLYYYPSTK